MEIEKIFTYHLENNAEITVLLILILLQATKKIIQITKQVIANIKQMIGQLNIDFKLIVKSKKPKG